LLYLAGFMFQFKQFTIHQTQVAMKLTEVACIQGAWSACEKADATLLDIGFGTGVLSLMMAQRFPEVRITAVEMDGPSFEQGRSNMAASPFADRIIAVQEDIREFRAKDRFDYIMVNPPFFENQLKSNSAEKNSAWHSTQLTLAELFLCLKNLLAPTGSFSILLRMDRKVEFEGWLTEYGWKVNRCLFIQHREKMPVKYFVAVCSSDGETYGEEFLIQKNDNGYTEAMQRLMQEFYLDRVG
jgi:tRNA1Val (adenine37-N6)-methyltransferase